MKNKNQNQPDLSLSLLYYAEACNEFAGPISTSLRLRATQLLSKKCRSDGKALATLCPIWAARDLNHGPPAPETNAWPLDQLADLTKSFIMFFLQRKNMFRSITRLSINQVGMSGNTIVFKFKLGLPKKSFVLILKELKLALFGNLFC